jgi:poly-gamma-glutamate capsule biosynthesis protein CapA/YwtB (metallophosphatase superfamily)
MPQRIRSVVITLLASIATLALGSSLAAQASVSSAPLASTPPPEKRIRIIAVGDVIPHQTVLDAFRKADGSYDFRPAFRFVKGAIESADIAICNVETVFSGDGGYSGYPVFDSPDSLAAALKDTGFDVGITSNNHLLDQGMRGIDGTIDALRRSGIVVAGTRKAGEPRFVLLERSGFKVAIIAYTFATFDPQGRLGFNTIPMPPQAVERVNVLTDKELQAGIAELRTTVAAARQAGAEIVVAYYHWGEEYDLAPRAGQIALAKASADMGIDLVFGSHPHVLQRFEMQRPPSGREVPVFYSLGNFLSNQRRDTMDNRLAEDGLIASVAFARAEGELAPRLVSANATATWVDKRREPLSFAVIPIDGLCMLNPLVVERSLAGDIEASLAASKNALGGDYFSQGLMLFTFHLELPR